jgi:hypothetical protein
VITYSNYHTAEVVPVRGEYRHGYVQYDRNWNDNRFYYPHYAFDYRPGYFVSPWYGYSAFPGYIEPYRCSNVISVNFGWGLGIHYIWDSYSNHLSLSYNEGRYRDYRAHDSYALDRSSTELREAFNRRDIHVIDNMLPRGYSVDIDMDGRPSYALSSDDFYDLMRDVVENTQTDDYIVRDVYENGSQATVVADHYYRDADGVRQHQKHWFGLQLTDGHYRVVSFRTTRD